MRQADFTRQIELRVENQEREARQLAQLTGLRQVDRAAGQARFAILNQFAEAQIQANAKVLRAEEDILEARRELERITDSLGDTTDQEDRDRLISARQRSAQAEIALAEARAYREELERGGDAARAAAEASAASTSQNRSDPN